MELGKSASAFKRARWLAELADAIDAAEGAANRLVDSGRYEAEVGELLDQLGAAKREVEDLRLGGWRAPVQELGSKWIKLGND